MLNIVKNQSVRSFDAINTMKDEIEIGFKSIVNYTITGGLLIADKGKYPFSDDELDEIVASIYTSNIIGIGTIKRVIKMSLIDISNNDDYSEWQYNAIPTREFYKLLNE